jgi:hypothetical protein
VVHPGPIVEPPSLEIKRRSFLKKRTKKLLFAVADLSPAPALRHKSFLLLFFKKEGLDFPFMQGGRVAHRATTWRKIALSSVKPSADPFLIKGLTFHHFMARRLLFRPSC